MPASLKISTLIKPSIINDFQPTSPHTFLTSNYFFSCFQILIESKSQKISNNLNLFPSHSSTPFRNASNISTSRLWSRVFTADMPTRYNNFNRICTVRKIWKWNSWTMSRRDGKHTKWRQRNHVRHRNWNQNTREMHVAAGITGKSITRLFRESCLGSRWRKLEDLC